MSSSHKFGRVDSKASVTRGSSSRRGSDQDPASASKVISAASVRRVDAAIRAIDEGTMVVVFDAGDRENEGDLILAADMVTPDAVNFMATEGRGLICVPMHRERLRELEVPPMVARSHDPQETAFHVGVDARIGTSTGISASDRAVTIRALADSMSFAADFVQPGHVFPLACRDGGVLARPGHTEAAVDLAVLAGHAPCAVICEIADASGEMARLPGLRTFAEKHGLPIMGIDDLIAYRRSSERRVFGIVGSSRG